MIFVTVGTYKFNELIEEVDALVASGIIKDDVICQIGCGNYIPVHVSKWLRYTTEVEKIILQADLVIGHGGTGTTLAPLRLKTRFIGVVNRSLADNHQLEFLEAMKQLGAIEYCEHVKFLSDKYLKYLSNDNESYNVQCIITNCEIAEDIAAYID